MTVAEYYVLKGYYSAGLKWISRDYDNMLYIWESRPYIDHDNMEFITDSSDVIELNQHLFETSCRRCECYSIEYMLKHCKLK